MTKITNFLAINRKVVILPPLVVYGKHLHVFTIKVNTAETEQFLRIKTHSAPDSALLNELELTADLRRLCAGRRRQLRPVPAGGARSSSSRAAPGAAGGGGAAPSGPRGSLHRGLPSARALQHGDPRSPRDQAALPAAAVDERTRLAVSFLRDDDTVVPAPAAFRLPGHNGSRFGQWTETCFPSEE